MSELHSKGRWRRLARYQLRMHPLCAMCLQKGLPVPATVADHVTPHRGDTNSFWLGRLQSLCAPCHNGRKQREELGTYQLDVDRDGWPLDPKHPANKPRSASRAR